MQVREMGKQNTGTSGEDMVMQETFRERSMHSHLLASNRKISAKRSLVDKYVTSDASRFPVDSQPLRGSINPSKRATSPVSVNWRITSQEKQTEFRRTIRIDTNDESNCLRISDVRKNSVDQSLKQY